MKLQINERAIEKLKDLVSYNLSEVCTDKEEFYKSQRKFRAKKNFFLRVKMISLIQVK